MADLEMAAVPLKSIAPDIQCSTDNPTHRSSSHAEIEPQLTWSSTHQHQNHHGTQLYIQPQDDPLPAMTMNHVITTPNHLAACLLQQSQTTRGKSHNNGAITTVMGIQKSNYQHPHHPSTQTYMALHDDPLLGPTPHHVIISLAK